MSAKHPGTLIATKQDNPLVIGIGEGENFIASDIPAIIQRTRRTYILNDGEMAVLTKDSINITNRQGEPVTKKSLRSTGMPRLQKKAAMNISCSRKFMSSRRPSGIR